MHWFKKISSMCCSIIDLMVIYDNCLSSKVVQTCDKYSLRYLSKLKNERNNVEGEI